MLALVAPSIVFLALFFVAPLGFFLFRSVDNSDVPGWLPRTVATLAHWNGSGLPDEAAYRAVAAGLDGKTLTIRTFGVFVAIGILVWVGAVLR